MQLASPIDREGDDADEVWFTPVRLRYDCWLPDGRHRAGKAMMMWIDRAASLARSGRVEILDAMPQVKGRR